MNRVSSIALLVAVILGGCATTGTATAPPPTVSSVAPSVAASTSPSAAPISLTVFAAASLADVLKQVQAAYAVAYPGTTITVSTDSSAALETQIEQGAPADVFLSADTANPQKLVAAGLSAGQAVIFAGNKLTIVVPTDNPADVTSPKDLARPGLKVIAAGDAVPITKYATRLIDNLAKESGYPADFAAGYAANVVSREDNVQSVIAKLGLGQGDAGVVYVTDAAASTKVTTIDVPDTANVPARYAGVVVGASANQEAARTFLGWLTSPDGQAVLHQFGFLSPTT